VRAALSLVLAAPVLAGCGGVSLDRVWPFGAGGPREVAQAPGNAVEYRCEGGKRFFVRPIADGAVWLIAPDREVRLERIGGPESTRYGVARVELALAGDDATLFDPPASFSGCRRAEAGK
jgi:hypothetical protein